MTMARTSPFTSPDVAISITEDLWEKAKAANSRSCVWADAIKAQVPGASNVEVDLATIRWSDKAKGLRYVYLTPDRVRLGVISFDQGWEFPGDETIRIRRAIKIDRLTRKRSDAAKREQRRAELEAKEAAGELTRGEAHALSTIRRHDGLPRASSEGPMEMGGPGRGTIIGGKRLPAGTEGRGRPRKAPQVLGGHHRVYGGKVGNLGAAFDDAVAKATQAQAQADLPMD
jgi:hypothetical protein